MQVFISIDDTDNHGSIGSGSLAENLANTLLHNGLISHYSSISRHQLFYNDLIPYTSHNSSMCFCVETKREQRDELVNFTSAYLVAESASGSDPGLCVANEVDAKCRKSLIDFGRKAKQEVLTKEDAFNCARTAQVHLSEHGGTGDGIIGALAGIGLRLSGNDGRFRGWLSLGKTGETMTLNSLCTHPMIDGVVTDTLEELPGETEIVFGHDQIKTVLLGHRQVLPVTRMGSAGTPMWTTLSKKDIKRF